MCLKALTPLVSKAIAYFDLAYLCAMTITENGVIQVIESECVTDHFLETANDTEIESFEHILRSQQNNRPYDRLARKIRPRRQLRRNTSTSTARSDCSERIHASLRIQESLSTFPRFQEPSFIPFWSSKKDKRKRRSLQGKTVPKSLPVQYED
ncbi:hypothetical protein KVR01_000651 [Diaporthe batatas]|uniref:uncharacterized protein n=1 Tax=Diaporthe batatas TaxID=748121 RepID=UPI001D045C52|nr:uncharacterized protein KVR01_000651 [Diaporthe batatas]KAG8169906.1 hypothetical protein KVR01_000651 [Diaporthe batatas]